MRRRFLKFINEQKISKIDKRAEYSLWMNSRINRYFVMYNIDWNGILDERKLELQWLLYPVCAPAYSEQNRTDLHLILDELWEEAEQIIVNCIRTGHGNKVQTRICIHVHQLRGGDVIPQSREMHMSIRLEEYSEHWYEEAMTELVKSLDEYAKNGSGWIVENSKKVTVAITSYKHLNCKGHVDMEMPKEFKGKRAVKNMWCPSSNRRRTMSRRNLIPEEPAP